MTLFNSSPLLFIYVLCLSFYFLFQFKSIHFNSNSIKHFFLSSLSNFPSRFFFHFLPILSPLIPFPHTSRVFRFITLHLYVPTSILLFACHATSHYSFTVVGKLHFCQHWSVRCLSHSPCLFCCAAYTQKNNM